MTTVNKTLFNLVSDSLGFPVDENTLFYCVEDDSDGEGYIGHTEYYLRLISHENKLYFVSCDEHRELDEDLIENPALIKEDGYCVNERTKEEIAYYMEALCVAYDGNNEVIYDVAQLMQEELHKEYMASMPGYEEV